MTLVEKIARHLCKWSGNDPDVKVVAIAPHHLAFGPLGHQVIDGTPSCFAWELYAPFVRETILQIREPTDSMLEAQAGVDGIKECYQAMIDDLLTSEVVPEPEAGPEVPETKSWRANRGL